MSTDEKPEPGDIQPKPMKGKYDGRRNNGKSPRRVKPGPKPNWAKNLERNSAAKSLREFDDIATPAQIYRSAWEKGDVKLCAEMYRQFQDRLLGRPFVAENPAKTDPTKSPDNDEKLQGAVKRLILKEAPVPKSGEVELPKIPIPGTPVIQ